MPIFAGRRRGRRWCTRGVGGALNRWPAPDLGAALCLHPVRTQGVGSTAVVPIAHSRSLIEHLQVKGHSLRWSPLPVCRCSFYLLFLTFSCLQVEIMPSCPPSEKSFFFFQKWNVDPVTREPSGPATGPGRAAGVAAWREGPESEPRGETEKSQDLFRLN